MCFNIPVNLFSDHLKSIQGAVKQNGKVKGKQESLLMSPSPIELLS